MLSGLYPLLAAILTTIALIAASGAFKATSFFFNLLVPLPVALLTLRRSPRQGVIAVLVTAVLLVAFSPTEGMLPYLLQFGIASYLLPLLLRRGWRWDKAIAVTLATVLLALFVALAFAAANQGTTIGVMTDGYIAREMAQVKELYGQAQELPPDQKDQLLQALDQMDGILRMIWPAFLTLLGGFLLLVQVMLLSALPATRQLIPGPAFIDWKAPDLLVWPLISAGFSAFLTTGTVQSVAINLLVVLIPIYYVQGLAIVTYFFQQRGISPWLRALGYLLLALFNPLPLFVAGAGLFDLWGNFRRERVKPNPE